MTSEINFILAISNNNIIGINNSIPWNIKDDSKHFKDLTSEPNSAIIMGYKTFESLNKKPLINRLNIVITSKYESYQNHNNLLFLGSVKNAIYYSNIISTKKIWIIGGSSLYEQINDIKPDYIYLTKINTDIPETDSTIKLSNQFFQHLEQQYLLYTYKIKYCDDTISKKQLECQFNQYKIKQYPKPILEPLTEPNNDEQQYLNLLKETILNGDFRKCRNDYTWSNFGSQLTFNLKNGFPLLTSKKVALRLIFEELMFFIRGYTDNKVLQEKNIGIWNGNTTKEFIETNNKKYQNSDEYLDENDMGPMYGFQWRHFNAEYIIKNNPDNQHHYQLKGFDQLNKVIQELINDPYSRRIMMTTFNPLQVDNGVLYPCHSIILQFYTKLNKQNNHLAISIKMYQRSADLFLGLPFNIASTSLLLILICDHLNKIQDNSIYEPDMMIITLGDQHVYQSHLNAVLTQLQNDLYSFPTLEIINGDGIVKIEDYQWENIRLVDYKSNQIIKANMIA